MRVRSLWPRSLWAAAPTSVWIVGINMHVFHRERGRIGSFVDWESRAKRKIDEGIKLCLKFSGRRLAPDRLAVEKIGDLIMGNAHAVIVIAVQQRTGGDWRLVDSVSRALLVGPFVPDVQRGRVRIVGVTVIFDHVDFDARRNILGRLE